MKNKLLLLLALILLSFSITGCAKFNESDILGEWYTKEEKNTFYSEFYNTNVVTRNELTLSKGGIGKLVVVAVAKDGTKELSHNTLNWRIENDYIYFRYSTIDTPYEYTKNGDEIKLVSTDDSLTYIKKK